ncbi:hypothetical protein IW150_003100 [Coemansia sp. RSA 2607]|nr:hypothetical protein IW150_003100 [Coemansia sp. RSA 2607]
MVPTASYYVGNAVTGVYAPASVKDLVEKPIIDMARHIKSHVNRVTPGAAVHLTEESFSPNSDFVLRVLSTNNRPGAFIAISNVSRLPFYSLDFGLGTPKAVLCGTKPTEGMMFWMPHGSEDNEDDDGGVDIYCGLLDSVFLLLKKDNILGKFAKFLC